jgi:hypothetical protein
MMSSAVECSEVGAEGVVGLTGDVALEAAEDLASVQSLGAALAGVGRGSARSSGAADRDHVQRSIGPARQWSAFRPRRSPPARIREGYPPPIRAQYGPARPCTVAQNANVAVAASPARAGTRSFLIMSRCLRPAFAAGYGAVGGDCNIPLERSAA